MLLLVRHAETAANARGHLLGRADPPAEPDRREQAAALAAWLPPADLVVSSPLRRARQTAAAARVAGARRRAVDRAGLRPVRRSPAGRDAGRDVAAVAGGRLVHPPGVEPDHEVGGARPRGMRRPGR